LLERSFVCFSAKPTEGGNWAIVLRNFNEEFRKVHQFNVSPVHLVYYALADYLQQKEPYLQLGRSCTKGLFQQLSQTKFKALPTYGSYFHCTVTKVLPKKLKRISPSG
jgi:hypothetical protein